MRIMASPERFKFITLAIMLFTAISCILIAGAQELPRNSSINSNNPTNLNPSVILAGNESGNWSDWQNQSLRQSNGSENQTSENQDEIRRHIDAPTWNHYGLMVYQRGYANRSIVYFNRSINESPSFVDPWNNMGVAYIALYNYSEAEQCFDRALQISVSDGAILWNNKGVALYRIGLLHEAQDCFNRSLEQDPNYSPAWNNLGAVMAAQKLDQQALELYTKSISSDMYNKVAWNNKGRTLTELGRYGEAWDCLHNALILDKNYTLAWVNAADYYYKVGDLNNYQGALIITRMQGYNETEPHWPADTLAVMMKDNMSILSDVLSSRTPATGWMAAVFGLLSVWTILRIRKRRSVA
ncbi:MAG: tetratricopeptide repeat protein [Methanothrix sp.]|nr:tetratricopeptide repeat protein [Methanothrix sp.]